MAETLTHDATEAESPQFSDEELDSLQVGEQLAEQQDQLLAGKYENAQQLEKAYVELESKLGQQRTEEPQDVTDSDQQPQEETPEIDTSFLDTLWEESQGEFKDETMQTLSKMDPSDLAQMYLQERSQRSESEAPVAMTPEIASDLKDVVGGEGEYNAMLGWAKQNLRQNEIEMYDTVMNRGDPLSCYFAVQALAARYFDGEGQEAEPLTGKAPSASSDLFRSQAELVRAMSDKRYDNDPAYRQDVINKLDRSEINF